jgi:hypothetical protein
VRAPHRPEVDGLHARVVALPDNPVMPTPTGSGRSRGPRF